MSAGGFTVDEAAVGAHIAAVGEDADRLAEAARASNQAFSPDAYGVINASFAHDLERTAALSRSAVHMLALTLTRHREQLTDSLADYRAAEDAATAGFTEIAVSAFGETGVGR